MPCAEYLVSELEAVGRDYMRLSEEGEGRLATFISQRKEHTKTVMAHAGQLERWESDRYLARQVEEASIASARKEAYVVNLPF